MNEHSVAPLARVASADRPIRLRHLVERVRVEIVPPILSILHAGAGRVTTKANEIAGDVVTDVDYAVQALLAERLPRMLDGSRFVGEEDFVEIANPDVGAIWIADPLDGTVNFAVGLPFWGTSIALLWQGVPVLAFVLDGASGTVWDAVADAGARRDGVAFAFDPALAATAPVSVSSGTIEFDAAHPDLGLLTLLRRANPRLRILGSQALQLCYAAEGRLRLLINRETRLWDDAAGWLVCREAGAAHALASGEPLFPLVAGSFAVRGERLFSISGEPALVAEVATRLRPVAGGTP